MKKYRKTKKTTQIECFQHNFVRFALRAVAALRRQVSFIGSRIKDKFYGFKVGQLLEKLPKSHKAKFEIAAMKVYERAIVYLRKWFDLKNSPFKTFKCLSLQMEVNFKQIVACFKLLGRQFDGDKL
jgi:hypothetical protein